MNDTLRNTLSVMCILMIFYLMGLFCGLFLSTVWPVMTAMTAIYAIAGLIGFVFLMAGFMFLADYGKGYNFLTMDDGTDNDQ